MHFFQWKNVETSIDNSYLPVMSTLCVAILYISPGHKQFCLYDYVIKYGVRVQFPKPYTGPNF